MLVILLASAAFADDYTDSLGRYAIHVPAGWSEVQPREGAAVEWTYGGSEPAGHLWVAIESIAPRTGRDGQPLAPLEAHVLSALQPWLDQGYAIDASAKLGGDALRGHNVDAGIGFRLASRERGAYLFLVLMAAGDTGIAVCGELPQRGVSDGSLIRSLQEAMGSFRYLGPGAGATATATGPEGSSEPGSGGHAPLSPDTADIVFVDDFVDGVGPAWRWDPATGAKDPSKPWVRDGRLAFRTPAGELFAADKPAPVLSLPGIVVPAEVTAEVVVHEGAVDGDVLSLLVYDSPDRAAILQVLPSGKGGGAVSASFRRGKRVSGKTADFTGSRVWLRLSPDGKRVAAAFSTDGSQWTSLQPDKLPASLPLSSPSVGVAITGPGSGLSVERVTVSRSATLATRPPVAWLGASSDGNLVSVGCEVTPPADRGALREISIEVPAGDRSMTVRLAREGDGPLMLTEDAGGAVAAVSVVPASDGKTAVRIAFSASDLPSPPDRVTVSAVTDTGWKSGRWLIGPSGAEMR